MVAHSSTWQTQNLLVVNPGQSWESTTGGILVSDGSNMDAANGNLAITGSYGHGIVVLNNSHATLGAFTLTGSVHGGLVTANLSCIDVAASTALSNVGGNSVDLFCDSGSVITGRANIAGAHCGNFTWDRDRAVAVKHATHFDAR